MIIVHHLDREQAKSRRVPGLRPGFAVSGHTWLGATILSH